MRIVLAVTALVLAACAGGTATSSPDAPSTATTATTSSSEAPTTVLPSDSPGTTAETDAPPVTRPAPNPDRPLAPDFSLTLSDGTVYEFASEVRPVFMVFWAEW